MLMKAVLESKPRHSFLVTEEEAKRWVAQTTGAFSLSSSFCSVTRAAAVIMASPELRTADVAATTAVAADIP